MSPDFFTLIWHKLGNIILLRWLNSTLITGLLAIAAALIGAGTLWNVTVYTRENSKRDNLLKTSATAYSVAEAILKYDGQLSDNQLNKLEEQCTSLLNIQSKFGLDMYKSALQITRWSRLCQSNSLYMEAAYRAKAISVLCLFLSSQTNINDAFSELIDPTELRTFAGMKNVFGGYTNHLTDYFDWTRAYP